MQLTRFESGCHLRPDTADDGKEKERVRTRERYDEKQSREVLPEQQLEKGLLQEEMPNSPGTEKRTALFRQMMKENHGSR